MKRILSLLIGMTLLAGVMVFAQAKSQVANEKPAKEKAAISNVVIGTVSSALGSNLALSHKVKGKEETSTFIMNEKTQKNCDLAVGARVAVHYTVEGGQKIATMVNAAAANARTTKK